MLPKEIKKEYKLLISELEKKIEGERFNEIQEELRKAYMTLEDYYTEKSVKIKADFLDGLVIFSAIGGGIGYTLANLISNSEINKTILTAAGASAMVGFFLFNSQYKEYLRKKKDLYNEVLSDYQALKTLVLESKDSEVCKEYITKWNAIEAKKLTSSSIVNNWF